MTTSHHEIVAELLEHGRGTYALEGGITLRDKPAPLFQLLVLCTLAATRIDAGLAAAAARELFRAGWRTPERLAESTWQQRVDALGRGGYRRYDESTASSLEETAIRVLEDHDGDLRRLRPPDRSAVPDLEDAIASFPRIGPVGARIFCREVQEVWPTVRPYFDPRALRRAEALGLPTDLEALAALAPQGRLTELAAALGRSA